MILNLSLKTPWRHSLNLKCVCEARTTWRPTLDLTRRQRWEDHIYTTWSYSGMRLISVSITTYYWTCTNSHDGTKQSWCLVKSEKWSAHGLWHATQSLNDRLNIHSHSVTWYNTDIRNPSTSGYVDAPIRYSLDSCDRKFYFFNGFGMYNISGGKGGDYLQFVRYKWSLPIPNSNILFVIIRHKSSQSIGFEEPKVFHTRADSSTDGGQRLTGAWTILEILEVEAGCVWLPVFTLSSAKVLVLRCNY